MRPIRILTIAALLALATGGWWLQPAPAAVPTAPVAANPLSQDTKDLLKRLQSTNPAERKAAQDQLNALMELFRQPEILKQLADAAPDSELKSFFQSRLSQLKAQEEQRLAANLPGISLSVNNASLSEVIDALNQALDTSNKLQYTLTGNPNGSYTLDAKNKPFWEIVTALQQQQPFSFNSSTTTAGPAGTTTSMRILPTNTINTAGTHPFAIDGPGVAFLNGITLQRSLTFQTTTPSPSRPNLSVSLALLADPRLRVSGVRAPTISNAVDDQGHNLTPPTTTGGFSTGTAAFTSRSFSLNSSPSLGKTISFTYESAFEIATGSMVETLDDVQNNLNKAVTVGDFTVRVNSFTPSPTGTTNSISISVTSSAPPQGIVITSGFTSGRAAPAGRGATAPLTIALTDATGRNIRTMNLPGTTTTSFTIPTGTTPPYKLEVRASTGTIQIPVRFQFKDIPLP